MLQILPQLPSGSKIDYDIEVQHGDVITDLVIHYKNEFRGETRTYYVEVELDSTGDVGRKIRAYEEIIEDDDVLLVVCKHKRTEVKILGEKHLIKVKTCLLENVLI